MLEGDGSHRGDRGDSSGAPGGEPGRGDGDEHADRGGHDDGFGGQHDGPVGHVETERAEHGGEPGGSSASERDPGRRCESADGDGFDDDGSQDLSAVGADGSKHRHFACALGDGD
jgi:hypothetical protein